MAQEQLVSRRNPFGISENEEYFEEKLTCAVSEMTGESNMTQAIHWLNNWNNEVNREEKKGK